MANTADELKSLRKRVRNGDRSIQFEPDRHHLLKMSDNIRLLPSEIGDHRHIKILRHNLRMANLPSWPTIEDFEENDEADDYGVQDEGDIQEILDEKGFLGLALESRAASEAVVRWIHDEYDNEHTNQDYRTAFRRFGTYRLKLDEPPDSLRWIPTTTSNDFNPVPSERDLLVFDDVLDMIDAAQNPRDKAIFALQFEAGLRGGELWDLRVGDIFDGEYCVGIHADGKKGEKPVHLIWSVTYLQGWLEDHPAAGDDDAYMWTKQNVAKRPSRKNFYEAFQRAADNAGVTKEVTPTNFRKSNTRWLLTLGMSTPRIEDRQGRVRGSKHTARYQARFGAESNEKVYARLHGIEVDGEEDAPEVGPVECPRCHRDTPREEDFCMWCHFALSFDATDDIDQVDDETAESIAKASDDEIDEVTPEDVVAFRRAVEESPELKRLLSSVT